MELEDQILRLAGAVRSACQKARDSWVTWRLVKRHLGGEAGDEYVEVLLDLPGMHRWFHTLRDFKVGLTVEGLSLTAGDAEELRKLRSALKGRKSTARGEESPVSSDMADTPSTGFLRWLGYRVGSGGPGSTERQDILQSALAAEVPTDEFSPDYVRQWGPPNSPARLGKLVSAVAGFCGLRRAKLRSSGLSEAEASADDAVADWEDDLRWLRTTFDHGDSRRHELRG